MIQQIIYTCLTMFLMKIVNLLTSLVNLENLSNEKLTSKYINHPPIKLENEPRKSCTFLPSHSSACKFQAPHCTNHWQPEAVPPSYIGIQQEISNIISPLSYFTHSSLTFRSLACTLLHLSHIKQTHSSLHRPTCNNGVHGNMQQWCAWQHATMVCTAAHII